MAEAKKFPFEEKGVILGLIMVVTFYLNYFISFLIIVLFILSIFFLFYNLSALSFRASLNKISFTTIASL